MLGPLLIRPATLSVAKVLASASVIGLSALVLNSASGMIWPAALAQGTILAVLRSYLGYWLIMLLAVLFLFAAVLLVQSATALILPRRLFLRFFPILQLIVCATILASFFLGPEAPSPEQFLAQAHVPLVSWFPPYCFTAMFFQLQGNLPPNAHLTADCGWLLLGGAVSGMIACVRLLYTNLLSHIVATPELARRRSASGSMLKLKGALESALFLFMWRSFIRGKQQKLILSFYLGIGSAVLFALLRVGETDTRGSGSREIGFRFMVSTIVMMTVVIVGVRASFAIPVSLRANWIFRLHQIESHSNYLTAVRSVLVMFSVVPVCVASLTFGLMFEPVAAVLEHVLLLSLYGCLLAGVCMYGNDKLPYTCSYLPGSSQAQFLFWGCFIPFLPIAFKWASVEQGLVLRPLPFGLVCVSLLLCVCALEWRNRALSANTELNFDDLPEDVIVSLSLGGG